MLKKLFSKTIFFYFVTLKFSIFSQSYELGLPIGHDNGVINGFFCNQDKNIITNSGDCIIWDVKTGSPIRSFRPSGLLKTSQISHNGKLILTSSSDYLGYDATNYLSIFNTETGKKIIDLKGHEDVVDQANFSLDNKFVLTNTLNTVKFWNTANGEELYSLTPHDSGSFTLITSPENKRFITYSKDSLIKLWDTASGKLIKNTIVDSEKIFWVTFNKKADKLLIATANRSVYIVDLNSGIEIQSIKKFSSNIRRVFFSSDESKLITVDSENKLTVWSNQNKVKKIFEVDHVNYSWNNHLHLNGDKMITYDKYLVKVWDINTGQLIAELYSDGNRISSVSFSENGKYIMTTSQDEESNSIIWSTKTFKPLKHLKNHTSPLINAKFDEKIDNVFALFRNHTLIYQKNNSLADIHQNGKISPLILFNSDKTKLLQIVDKNTIRTLDIYGRIISEYNEEIFYIDSSNNILNKAGTKLFSMADFSSVKLWDKSLDLYYKLPNSQVIGGEATSIKISKKFSILALINPDASIQIFDLRDGQRLESLGFGNYRQINSFEFNEKNGNILIALNDGSVLLFEISNPENSTPTIKELGSYKHTDGVQAARFILDSMIVSASVDNTCRLWSINSESENLVFDGHSNTVESIDFNKTNTKLLSSSSDGSFIVWDLFSGKMIIRSFIFDNDITKSLNITSEGYFFGARQSVSLLFYTKGINVYSISQFDLKYNRPDIVLDRLGYASQETIDQYKRAYEKRLKKMGFTEDMLQEDFHLPEVKVENENDIPVEVSNEELTLNLSCTDTKYPLDRVNIWVNNVPIYGINGISLLSKMTQDFDTTIQVLLNEGENKIEVSLLNQAGAESYKETVYTTCTKKAPKPNLYFIGIGVSDYADANMNLKYSDKDIRDIAEMYAKNKSYGEVYIDTFLNSSVTTDILPIIQKRLASTTIHDQVIFMYSGHGLLDDNMDYYLTTHDIDFLNPSEKGLPYDKVDEFLDGIPARQKLVLIDACHSGEVDKDDTEITSNSEGVASTDFTKGNLFQSLKTKTNSFELMKELFTDLRRGTGATVISSSSGLYYSFEDAKYQNGIYTYALKLGLEGEADVNNDDTITVKEIKDYLYNKVLELTNGKQKPNTRQENLEYDFRVW